MPGDNETNSDANVLRVALDLGRGTARVLSSVELRAETVAAESARERAGVTVLREQRS